jgi:hypothetical protein
VDEREGADVYMTVLDSDDGGAAAEADGAPPGSTASVPGESPAVTAMRLMLAAGSISKEEFDQMLTVHLATEPALRLSDGQAGGAVGSDAPPKGPRLSNPGSMRSMQRHMASGSARLQDRNIAGYLDKRGGKLGNRGWDTRYFYLDKDSKRLSYFHTEEAMAEPGAKPLGIIPLRDMQRVTPTSMVPGPHKRRFRFELETPERTWFLSAKTAEEMTRWMMTLSGHIIAYVADPTDDSIGGSMANPDKCGRCLFCASVRPSGTSSVVFGVRLLSCYCARPGLVEVAR